MYILYVSNEVESIIAEWLLKTLGYKFKKIKVTPRTKGWMLSEFGTAKTPILCSECSYWVGLQSIERFIGFQEHRFECGEWNRVIYVYLFQKYFPRHAEKLKIRVDGLSNYEEYELKRLRKWIFQQQQAIKNRR